MAKPGKLLPAVDRSVPEVTLDTLRAKLPGLAKRAQSSPLAAVRLYCLDCSGSCAEVEACPAGPGGEAGECALWAFRLGRRPGPGRQMTDEQRAAAGARLAAVRATKAGGEVAGGEDDGGEYARHTWE